jgi:hypothetical protein
LQRRKTDVFSAFYVKTKFPYLLLFSFFGFALHATAADFTVINTANIGPGSLAQAILDANAQPGLDRIIFNIPGSGPHLIAISPTGLPDITDPIIIDGYTQPGAAPNALTIGDDAIIEIQIDGGTNMDRALVLKAGTEGSVVRGLSITGLITLDGNGLYGSGGAIRLIDAGGSTIEGNFLGLLPDGTTVSGAHIGVEVVSNGNQIGGTAPAARNVITGNDYGIVLDGPSGNKVEGNLIGTDKTGSKLGTEPGGTPHAQGIGIFVVSGDHSDTIIGGTAPGAGNVISGNLGGPGIKLGLPGSSTPVNDIVIAGNLIGTAANGEDHLPNYQAGIKIFGARNVVGGLDTAAANTIGCDQGPGVTVVQGSDNSASIDNRILSNIILGGSFLGIDLNGDVYTSNDLGDTDSGPNNLQNFPVITVIDPPAANGDITFHGELNSTPSSDFLLQFFFYKYPVKPRFLGNLSVTTTAGGRARFDFVAPGLGSVKGGTIASTATDSAGNTSELGFGGGVQLANISTRARIETGDNILIGGFVLHDNSQPPKKVLIRAIGPSLNLPNGLADPYLELYDGHGTLLAENDNWRSNQEQVMGSGIPPSNDSESAIVAFLTDGSYTAKVHGVNGGTGVGVIEIYDLDPFPIAGSRRLVTLSTRGLAGANDNLLIGGLIVRGDSAQRLIVRAIGPDLIAVGLPGALPDPTLELRDESGTLLAANDNWRDTQEQEIQSTQLAPNDNRDSAIVTTLAPGFYTAVVRGKDATGLGLVEFYTLFPLPSEATSNKPSGGQ